MIGCPKKKVVVCTYHRSNDARDFLQLLMEIGFYCRCSDDFLVLMIILSRISGMDSSGHIRTINEKYDTKMRE